MAEPHHGDVLINYRFPLLAGHGWHHLIDGQADVLAHREPGQQGVVLKYHHLVWTGALHRFAIEQHRASGRHIQAGNHVEQGALSTAGMADQGDEFPFLDLQINALQCQVVASTAQGEILLNLLNLNKASHWIFSP